MRYLKHMTQTWSDERISALIGEGGIPGLARYGLYWRVNEIIAAQMDPKQPNCGVTYSLTRWSTMLSVRGSHLRHLLGHLSENGLVTVEWMGTDVRVTNRNLLKYRDEYSQRSGQDRENLPTLKGGGEERVIVDTQIQEEEPPPPREEEIRLVNEVLKLTNRPVDDKVAPAIIAKCREDKPATPIKRILWATRERIATASKRQHSDQVRFVLGTVAATCHGSGFEEQQAEDEKRQAERAAKEADHVQRSKELAYELWRSEQSKEEARNRFLGPALLKEAAAAHKRRLDGPNGKGYADSYRHCNDEVKAEIRFQVLCAEVRDEKGFATWEDYERSLTAAPSELDVTTANGSGHARELAGMRRPQ